MPTTTVAGSAPLASLTDEGIRQFKLLLAKAAGMELGHVQKNIARIANSEKLCTPTTSPVSVRLFPDLATRGDTAAWVRSLLEDSDVEAGPGSGTEGMFTWLAMVALPSLCRRNKSGGLAIKDLERYVQSREARGFYRHLVTGPYWLEARHGSSSRVFLCQRAYEMPEVQEQIISRPWLRESRAVIEIVDRLYWDERTGAPKSGFTATDRLKDPPPGTPATLPRPGTLRALETLLGQLQCTHDLPTMTVDQLIRLLPAEFNPWLTGQGTTNPAR